MRWGLLAVAAVTGVGACSDREEPRERQPAAGTVERVVARDARLTAGQRRLRLLAIPRVGRLHVGCNQDRRTSTALLADHLLPTSDVVVERADDADHGRLDPDERFVPRADPFAVGIQRWQIAAFAKAQAPIATISVAARPVDSTCAISAQAIVFQSTAGTLTR